MKVFSEETRKRMSEAAKQRCTPEWRKKKSDSSATQLPADEVRSMYECGMTQAEIASRFDTTQKVVWKFMKRMGIQARIPFKRDQRGEKNSYWGGKSGEVGYQAYHCRVIAKRGQPMQCEDCGTTDPTKHYDWASLTKNYADVNDYKRLCRSCHFKMDGHIRNITGMRKRGAICQKAN